MSGYMNAEHLREWAPTDGGGSDAAPVYCDDCGERIEAEGAPCANCAAQPPARAFVFSRVSPTERAGDMRHYTATDPGEACTMLERAIAGTDDAPDNWSDAQVTCPACDELMLWWQEADHARADCPSRKLEAER